MQKGGMMAGLFLKTALRPVVLFIPVLFTISGCTIKMYEGPERELSQIAVIYMVTGNDRLKVSYLNDKYIKNRTNRARIHVLPGNNKLTLSHSNSETEGRKIHFVTYLYTVSIAFQAGHSYIAWSDSDYQKPLGLYQPPSDACMYEFSHADFEKLFEGNPHIVTSPDGGRKVGCGIMINAKEYKKQHG